MDVQGSRKLTVAGSADSSQVAARILFGAAIPVALIMLLISEPFVCDSVMICAVIAGSLRGVS